MDNMYKPDYNTLRKASKFSCHVSATYLALLEVTGIKIREMFLNPSAGIELYRKGRPLIREMYGPDVNMPSPMTAPVSYGHVNTLGVELLFPDDGEVNHGTLADSLEECVKILKKPLDFASAGMFPFYMEYRKKMQAAFPGEKIGFGYKGEGPLTTAYILRRDEFFYDPYDNPALTKDFLRLITESIIKFHYFLRSSEGLPEINPESSGLADDVASMLSPELWPEFVLPFLEQYFNGLTTGRRSAHIEDLRPSQLQFLEKLNLVSYDPSVSAKLNPKIISQMTRVPFSWRLCNFHYPDLTVEETADFVYQAVADGASGVFTYVCDGMCNKETVKKVHSFIAAGKNVEAMLANGASLEDIRKLVSESGRRKFWDNWPPK
jgi:hypothetical protein